MSRDYVDYIADIADIADIAESVEDIQAFTTGMSYQDFTNDTPVTKNPFARVGSFKEHPVGKYIPVDEFRAIHSHLPGFLRPVVMTAYLSGMRAGEIINLTWGQVDLEEGTLDLSGYDTKTDEPRIIYLASLPELRLVFVEAKLRKKKSQKLVFTKPDGKPIPGWAIRQPFLKACEVAGVGPYRFHDTRHSFNTNMIKAGVSKKDNHHEADWP